MDRLMELKRQPARRRPRLRPRAHRPGAPGAGAQAEVDQPTLPVALARGRDRQPGVRAAVPRLAGGQGHRPRRHRRLHQRDRAVPQPVAVPAREGRERRRVQGPHPARSCASSWPRPRQAGVLVPQVVYGYFAANGDGNDLVVWKDETRTAEWLRFPFPRQQSEPVPLHRRLLPARRVRRGRLRRLPHRHHGAGRLRGDRRAVRRRPLPGLPAAARPRRGDGRGAGRATGTAASARSGASPTRTGRTHRPVPPAVPRRPLLVGLPGLPRPRGQRQGGRAARGRPHRRRASARTSSTSPSRPPRRIICHHPKAKYFVAR